MSHILPRPRICNPSGGRVRQWNRCSELDRRDVGAGGCRFRLPGPDDKPELKNGLSWRGLGQVAVIGAAVSYSLTGVFGKRFRNKSPVVNSAGMLICSSIMMLPLALAINAPWSISPSPAAAAAVLGIAIISTAAAYLLYFRILADADATIVLLVTFLIPISALLLGVGVSGETVKVLEYVGMGCIFLGLIVIDGRPWHWVMNWPNLSQKPPIIRKPQAK